MLTIPDFAASKLDSKDRDRYYYGVNDIFRRIFFSLAQMFPGLPGRQKSSFFNVPLEAATGRSRAHPVGSSSFGCGSLGWFDLALA